MSTPDSAFDYTTQNPVRPVDLARAQDSLTFTFTRLLITHTWTRSPSHTLSLFIRTLNTHTFAIYMLFVPVVSKPFDSVLVFLVWSCLLSHLWRRVCVVYSSPDLCLVFDYVFGSRLCLICHDNKGPCVPVLASLTDPPDRATSSA